MPEAYIVDAIRTAGGRRNGRLKDWHPADLGGFLVDALLSRSDVDPELVEDLMFGCVTQAGEQAINVARAIVLSSRLPETTPGVTIDRQCGSSQQAVHFAAQTVMTNSADLVIAGGIESMTRVPLMTAANLPAEKGLGKPYGKRVAERYNGASFGALNGGERLAKKFDLTRGELDAYALQSHLRAAAAIREGLFSREIVPVPVTNADGEPISHDRDEGVRAESSLEALAKLKPLQEGGLLTAGSTSQVCDAASAVLVVNERGLKQLGATPIARIHHMSALGVHPLDVVEGPIPGTRRALERAGLKASNIDLFEVNEAYSSVPLAWIKAFDVDPERVNVHGGAIANGHPLGASGGKLLATLLSALKTRGLRWGLQAMCEGGGMANVTIVERL